MVTIAPVSLPERIIEGVILSLVCGLGLTGNIALWIVILRKKSFRTTSNALLLCLSGADILVSAFNMPITVYTLALGNWPFDSITCTVAGFVTMVTFIASVMSLGVISLNRYVLICHPSRFKSIYSPMNTTLMITGTWVFSIILATPPLLGWSAYDYLPGQSFCFCNWKTSVSYTFFMVGTCFGGPCSIMAFSYFKILLKVRASKRRVNSFNHLPNAESQTQNSSYKMKNEGWLTDATHTEATRTSQSGHNVSNGNQASRSCVVFKLSDTAYDLKNKKAQQRRKEDLRLTWSFLVVILAFVISWLPFCITMFCSVFLPVPVPRIPDMISLLLGCVNSACNPVIYGVMNKRLRDAFAELFCFISCSRPRRGIKGIISHSTRNIQTNIEAIE